MCYFINVSRYTPRNQHIQICRVCVDYAQAGDMMLHLGATAFPADKGYRMELFREDVSRKRVEAPEPRPHVHM